MKITKFDASRVQILKGGAYAGLILIRKSSGMDLGWENYFVDKGTLKGLTRRSYGQVRIALTDGKYLDGMAMYMDDDYFEEGIDIIAGRLSSKPKLKRYLVKEEDGEIIFDTPVEPVGEGNPINIVMPFNWNPNFTGERYTRIFKEQLLDKMMENEMERKEKANRELAESILSGDGFAISCENCAHYNDTLSMSDSPCYNCNRRMRDCWEAKKG